MTSGSKIVFACRSTLIMLHCIMLFAYSAVGQIAYSESKMLEAINRQDLPGIERIADQIELLFSTGETIRYYQQMSTLLRVCAQNPPATAEGGIIRYKIFLRYAALMAQKKPTLNLEDSDRHIVLQRQSLERIFNWVEVLKTLPTEAFSQVRYESSNLAVRFLTTIRTQKIPPSEIKPIYMNVPPPEGVPGVSGTNPASILLPEDRTKYEVAIQQNRKNVSIYNAQTELARTERVYFSNLRIYLVNIYSKPPNRDNEFMELLRAAGFSDTDIKEIASEAKKPHGLDARRH